MKKCLKRVQLGTLFWWNASRKINDAKLILCRIAIAEEGKPYRKGITPQIPHFSNQHESCYRPPCKCHVTQKSRNSSVQTTRKGKQIFRNENLSQY